MTGLPDIPAILAQRGSNPQQWIHLVVFLLVIGGSFLSWAFKQIQAKAEQKRRMDMAERRRLEELRTGRATGEPAPAPVAGAEPGATDRQRELAARRQAQLQELRRRQLERARQGAGGPQPSAPRASEPTRQTPLVIIPGSTGPIVVERAAPAPARPQRPTMKPAPVREPPRHPATVAPQSRPQPKAKKGRPSRQRQEAPAPSASIDREQFTHISQAAPPLEVSRAQAPSPVIAGAPRTPEDWRRALIAREILGRPLGERAGDPWESSII